MKLVERFNNLKEIIYKHHNWDWIWWELWIHEVHSVICFFYGIQLQLCYGPAQFIVVCWQVMVSACCLLLSAVCWQVMVSACLRTLLWPPTSQSSSAGISLRVTWTCCTTSGTKWFHVGTECSPSLRSVATCLQTICDHCLQTTCTQLFINNM